MTQLIYENEAAVLAFEYEEVMRAFSLSERDPKVADEAKTLSQWIKEYSSEGIRDIRITEDLLWLNEAGYLERLRYWIRDFISEKRGTIFCKECNRPIFPSEIRRVHNSPFDFYQGINGKTIKRMKKELRLKGPIRLGGRGGTAFFCANGHELFATIDWVV